MDTLPADLAAQIAAYLSPSTQLVFAICCTKTELSHAISILIALNAVDFGSLTYSVAYKLTEYDFRNVLFLIKSELPKFQLTRHGKPFMINIGNKSNLNEESVISILLSILLKGNESSSSLGSLPLIRLPKIWRKKKKEITTEFLQLYDKHLRAKALPCSAINCTNHCASEPSDVLGPAFINTEGPLYGLDNHFCESCRKPFCGNAFVPECQLIHCGSKCGCKFCLQCILSGSAGPKKCNGCNEHFCNKESCDLRVDVCQVCFQSKCERCIGFFPTYVYCSGCIKCFCEDCKTVFECDKCNESFCEDCKPKHFDYCDKCGDGSCDHCNCMPYCDKCDDFFCEDCKHFEFCCKCDKSFCEDCKTVFYCDKCNDFFCEDCKHFEICIKCDQFFCEDCKRVEICCKCDGSFCEECMCSCNDSSR